MTVQFPPLNDWQQEVIDDIKSSKYDTYVVKARRQCGKSILAITALLYYAFLNKSISVCIEPTLSQGRRVFKQIIDAVGGENSKAIKSANQSLLSIVFCNDSEIVFKSAEQEDALRGLTVKRGILIIDESAFIKDSIHQILYPIIDANKAPVMLLSTPLFMSGEFYTKYMEGLDSKTVHSYDWSKYDTSIYLSQEKLEYYRQTIAPLKFQSDYLGEFIAEGSYIFGDIGACVGDYDDEIPVYGGIDWGSGNDGDYTVVTFMSQKGNVTHIHSFKNLDAVEQTDKIAELLNNTKTLKSVQVEMNSIGRIFYENLRRKVSVHLKQFNTTNESKRTIIEALIEAFQKKEIGIPYDEELIRELQHYAMEKTKSGYTYNGADGVNDDYVMSLAFCYDLIRKRSNSFHISFA